jgi:puromycin-sensitive aminopeptidase
VSAPDPNRLPDHIVPRHYDLELDPNLGAATFAGVAAIDLDVLEPATDLVLHALDLAIDAAWLERDGNRIDATSTLDATTETATLALDATATTGRWTLHLAFRGALNDKLVGFYRSTFVDADGVERTIACTQFESTHARRAFPCWDEPAFKATFAVRLVVDEHLLAVSNGAELQADPLPDGRRRVHFATTMTMSTYLVAFVVGPLVATAPVDVDGVPLRIITPPGKEDQTSFALEVGAFSLRFLADWYDLPYPGDKLDLVAIPDFAFGAMENLGCVTFRETALLLDEDRATQAELQRVADVVAHEIAHMWFGDLVTMSWWNGIWLNEAFATFMEMLTTDAFRPEWKRWVDFGLARSAAFDTDSLAATRPIEYEVITAADAEGMFDVLTYEKGASVVRMLQQYLGEDRFQAGIRQYLRAHAHASTETTDLWDAIEAASDEPVRQMMDSWIYRPGHPVVRIEASADGRRLTLSQRRFSFAPDPAGGIDPPIDDVRNVPVVLRVGTDGSQQVHRVLLDGPTATLDLDAAPDWVMGNHEGNGFYRVELDDVAAATLAARAAVLSPLERYGLVEDEWALLLAGGSSVARVLHLVRSLGHDDDLSVWQRMLATIATIHRLSGTELEPEVEAWVRGVVGPALLRLGDAPSADEDDRTRALRAALFDASARLGGDETRRDQAARTFAVLGSPGATGAPPVDAEVADAVVRIVASTADGSTWQELRRRAATATTAQDRLRHHGALADASDVALVRRCCELCLTDEVRSQDAPFLLRRALTNRHAQREVWAFLAERWPTIAERFPPSMLPRLLDGIRTVSDPQLAEQIVAFLASHPAPQGATLVRQHVERMWVSVALGRRLPSELAAALA